MKAFRNVTKKHQAFHHSFLILQPMLKGAVGDRVVPKVTHFVLTVVTSCKYC